MWQKFVCWYQEWEREQMAVLANPALAKNTRMGYRRIFATKLADLSEVERKQLADFSTHYTGRKLWIPVAWMVLAFSVTGLLLQLALAPGFPLHKVLIGANAIGFTCVSMWIGAWFNYRQLRQRMVRVIALTIVLAIVGGMFGFGIAILTGQGGVAADLHKIPRLVGIIGVGTAVLLGVPMMLITMFRNGQYARLTADLQRDAEQARLARTLSETQLRLLRAQIEPAFPVQYAGCGPATGRRKSAGSCCVDRQSDRLPACQPRRDAQRHRFPDGRFQPDRRLSARDARASRHAAALYPDVAG